VQVSVQGAQFGATRLTIQFVGLFLLLSLKLPFQDPLVQEA